MTIVDGELTSLAFCWLIERADGAGVALTTCDHDIAVGDTIYRSAPGVTPAAVTRSIGLDPDTGEIEGALSADSLTESDLSVGRWNGAELTLTAVDWTDPTGTPMPLLRGELGEVATSGQSYSVELRGAASKLRLPACPSTSPECRAAFGDKDCRVDLAGRSMRARIVSATANVIELDRPVDPKFLFGRFRYLGGDNCGMSSAVLSIADSKVELRDRPRGEVTAGTTVELREGCDKRLESCASRFANAANFRGEPHLPGTDLLTRYPGA